MAQVENGGVVDVSPDRRIDVVLRPDRAVGEADFPTQSLLTARLAPSIENGSHAVGLVEGEARRPRSESRYLARGSDGHGDFISNGVNVSGHDAVSSDVAGSRLPERIIAGRRRPSKPFRTLAIRLQYAILSQI